MIHVKCRLSDDDIKELISMRNCSFEALEKWLIAKQPSRLQNEDVRFKISQLLYVGTDTLVKINGFQELKTYIFDIRKSILETNVMCSNLLSIILKFIII